ncbi:hypothetical protein M413DRAFT_323770 [Hebeloma cylindrosporum]|uniref:Cupredoxin n=1 Tax=Hebeloma cylindrosporum TaxID=76867 RepID=A0A0C2XDF9_HEBCY|nr:hypothetical protein M413DRAFT_323770 [Hebeloma cylindrosporum h7]
MLLPAVLSGITLASIASAQMTIQVGATATSPGGVFQFIPNNITAPNGTVVTFRFTGAPGNHSVTQSTFDDPCDLAPGGFDSGWVFIPPTPVLSATPEWNVTITDDREPIWFFCKQMRAPAHCISGMVGAINAPASGNTFDAFLAKAKAFSSTPGQAQGGLVGVGASASAQVEPIPSGATLYTGAPPGSTSSAPGSATTVASPSTTTASGALPGSTVTSPATASSPSATPVSAASATVVNPIVVLFIFALGLISV